MVKKVRGSLQNQTFPNINGGPEGDRTLDLTDANRALIPAELRAHMDDTQIRATFCRRMEKGMRSEWGATGVTAQTWTYRTQPVPLPAELQAQSILLKKNNNIITIVGYIMLGLGAVFTISAIIPFVFRKKTSNCEDFV